MSNADATSASTGWPEGIEIYVEWYPFCCWEDLRQAVTKIIVTVLKKTAY
jgi:hypothetical protein